MGNQVSTSSSKKRSSRKPQTTAEQAAERAKRVVGDLQEGIKNSVKRLDDDHPAAQLLDHVCGAYYHDDDKYRNSRSASYYSEEASEDGSRTLHSEDDTTFDGRHRNGRKSDKSVDSQSYVTQSDYDSDSRRRGRDVSFDTEDESRVTHGDEPKLISKPLASSFAKRCYFTKSGIGKTTQHYEGLTLTGNVVLMLASAMKLKGCPTICDEDLRRVEQTYPNQFSRLPDELLLSSGWRRISKYCHFSNKSIPDGIPFFHSKQRLHTSGGYYFLLAGSVGMIRPIDVEPLTKDTLVILETDFPNQCDATPSVLIRDPEQWVLVNKFCFFSGGPINTEEDVYYQADFDGNPIFMLAFLSPSLTPEELYKLTEIGPDSEPGLKSVVDVQEVESVYDLTERDFDDLKLYHLGPCRALPQYILQPSAWTKVLPPHFLAARQQAMLRAQDYDSRLEGVVMDSPKPVYQCENIPKSEHISTPVPTNSELPPVGPTEGSDDTEVGREEKEESTNNNIDVPKFQREIEEEGAFRSSNSVEDDAALDQGSSTLEEFSTQVRDTNFIIEPIVSSALRMDPPDDEPPSLKIESMEENHHTDVENFAFLAPDEKPDIDDQGFFTVDQYSLDGNRNDTVEHGNFPIQYPSPKSQSRKSHDYSEGTRAAPQSIDSTYPEQSQLPESIEHLQEENSPLSNNQHFEEPFGLPENDEHDDHYYEPNEDSKRRREELFEEPNEFVQIEESLQELPVMHENEVIIQEQVTEIYSEQKEFPDDSGLYDVESPYASSNSFSNNEYYVADEEKIGAEKDETDSQLNDSDDDIEYEIEKSPDSLTNSYQCKNIEPIDTSCTKQGEYDDHSASPPFSPAEISSNSGTDSRSHQSPAMRGAHEILKRNRRRRLEVLSMTKHNNQMSSPSMSENPGTSKSENSRKEAWDDSGSDITGSAISGSSVWTNNSGPGDRSSRRALILQMAKARMKNNKELPAVAKNASAIIGEDDEADDTIFTEGNLAYDIDLTGDLD
mmetsp:Transcript_43831/g.49527  ORF Transcript_43831/g.49527 Transcript_43831/m.49527 type:complete len:1006 (+) Transcript_43831:244-3261(+)